MGDGLHSPTAVVARCMCDAAAALVCLAGIAKAADVPAFESSLRTWAFIPEWLVFPLGVGIPTGEVGLALLWLFERRAIALGLMALMLVSFTIVFLNRLARFGPCW